MNTGGEGVGVAAWEYRHGGLVKGWPLHDIAITNIVCCIAYRKGDRGGGVVDCAIDVQSYCNSEGSVGMRGQ